MNSRVTIIAEAGVNYNGDIGLARELVDVAAESGADYVKFQTFKAANLVTEDAKKAEYQRLNMGEASGDSQWSMLKSLELTPSMHDELLSHCERRNIRFLSSAFDVASLEYLHGLGLRLAKLPSGEITNFPYLKMAATRFPEIILSTGMADMEEIRRAVDVLLDNGANKEHITVLHCNTEYPTPMEDVNLKAMLHIQQDLDVAVGYSDHTLGIEVPIAAVALGARAIEKHFTLNREMEGPDHRASLEPGELNAMIRGIRNIELAMGGDGIKRPSRSELKNKDIVRKSIYLSETVRSGDLLSEANMKPLRPGNGISPMEWDKLLGKQVVRDLPAGHQLRWEDIE